MLNSILVILFCVFALAFVLLAKHSMDAETHKHWAFTLLSAIPPFIIAAILLMLNNR